MHERPTTHFSAAEQANLIAGKVVARATAYLDGRDDIAALSRHARSLQFELLSAASEDAEAKPILDAGRLLTVAMLGAAYAKGEPRQDRWQQVMGSLVELVRHESLELRCADDTSTESEEA